MIKIQKKKFAKDKFQKTKEHKQLEENIKTSAVICNNCKI